MVLKKAGDLAREVKDEFSGEKEETNEEKTEERAEEMHMTF
jgi:hypothetical protein